MQLSLFATPIKNDWERQQQEFWDIHSWHPKPGMNCSVSTTIARSILWKEPIYSSMDIGRILKVVEKKYVIVWLMSAEQIAKVQYYEVDPLIYDYRTGNPYYDKNLDDDE